MTQRRASTVKPVSIDGRVTFVSVIEISIWPPYALTH